MKMEKASRNDEENKEKEYTEKKKRKVIYPYRPRRRSTLKHVFVLVRKRFKEIVEIVVHVFSI